MMWKIEKYSDMAHLLRGTIYDHVAYRALGGDIYLRSFYICETEGGWNDRLSSESLLLRSYDGTGTHQRDIRMIRGIIPVRYQPDNYVEMTIRMTNRNLERWRFRRDSNPQHSP